MRRGAQVVDLEGLANHRGSILGSVPDSPQPSQKAFESALVDAMRAFDPTRPVFLEAESSKIGRLDVPPQLFARLAEAPLVMLSLPTAKRVEWIRRGYAHFETPRFEDTLRRNIQFCAPAAGRAAVDRWEKLIDLRDWDAFVEAMLLDHYDAAYARAKDRDAKKADRDKDLAPLPLDLPDFDHSSMDDAADALVKKYDPQATACT